MRLACHLYRQLRRLEDSTRIFSIRTSTLTLPPLLNPTIHRTSISIHIVPIITLQIKPQPIPTDFLTQFRLRTVNKPNRTLHALVTVQAGQTSRRTREALFQLGIKVCRHATGLLGWGGGTLDRLRFYAGAVVFDESVKAYTKAVLKVTVGFQVASVAPVGQFEAVTDTSAIHCGVSGEAHAMGAVP